MVAHFMGQNADAGPVGVPGAVYRIQKIGVVKQVALAVVHHSGGVVNVAGGTQLKSSFKAHRIGYFPDDIDGSRSSLGLGWGHQQQR